MTAKKPDNLLYFTYKSVMFL